MIDLNAGKLRLVLDPETGGAIASFTHDGTPLLRPVADARLGAQRGRALAGYPLMPFANRVAWGRFSWDGRPHQLARNFGDHPHTIHGNAWMHPWSVVEATQTHAQLRLEFAPPPEREWPFAYQADQLFALDEHGLTITLRLRNTDKIAWPAGIGLHPYVARTPLMTLAFNADTVWSNDADALPADQAGITAALDFSEPRTLGAGLVDNCFAGWCGTASVFWPEHGLGVRITAAPPLDHLQVYTPVDEDFLGLEPVSNMPDAVNHREDVAGQGLSVLQPGETLEGVVRLALI